MARELDEECWRARVELGAEALVVVECRPASDRPVPSSRWSRYLFCRVTEAASPQHLDDYEQGLELRPQWVGLSHAAEVNQRLSVGGRPASWVERELTRWNKRRATNGSASCAPQKL